MNILVTGANGQLGNEMRVLSAENQQHTYFFTDVQELDICDEQAIRAFVTDNRVDVIVNCAAYTAVDKAEDNPELCDKLNHIAPGYLAAAAEACGAAMIRSLRITCSTESAIFLIRKKSLLALTPFTALQNWQVSRLLWRSAAVRWLSVRHGYIPFTAIIL